MERYSRITDKNRREIVLLRAFPCAWGKCTFCDYIEDNGKGFDIDKLDETKNKHFGIPVIRERIHLIGGKIDMKSKINKGTQIKIEVPLIF